MRILLTAYGPFREVKENITERVSDEIKKSWHQDDELFVLTLPVEWRGAERALTHALEALAPDVMVSLGHAEGASVMTVEARYFNIAEGEDHCGETREGSVVDPEGNEFYDTNIDSAALLAHLAQNDIPAVVHRGVEGMSYLCNFAGYFVMRHNQDHHTQKPLFIFLHLPPRTPLPVLVNGVAESLKFLITHSE